jgi:predicted pyridoxine 5'-phosphate oxidase superfamily flavin-nucleotide-binding protein
MQAPIMDTLEAVKSRREHSIQEQLGSDWRAESFYRRLTMDRINSWMRKFIGEQEMVFIATANAKGECDSSYRAGPKGFVRVLDHRTLMYPEYRGSGAQASLANLVENPHVGILFVDFFHHAIGLHISGKAEILFHEDCLRDYDLAVDVHGDAPTETGQQPELWVVVDVEEAYVYRASAAPCRPPAHERDPQPVFVE